ncbi:MAG TPA: type 2 lanthipeptide synthetase LanM, partial [Thermoanaerobaculia bacterium]|nr:type 2 lanthipeptide synthetase LanM [Thermoanaerobaculia bacterium]
SHRDGRPPGEPPEGPGPSRVLYTEFVLSHLEAGLLPLWEEFPVLARLQGTLARTWVAEQAELVHRLADDSQALREAFGAAGDVVALSPGLSDRHNGGRRVALLAFGSGSRVLYKPRTMSAEAGWNGLLAWLSDRGAPDAPPGLRILPRDGYGWAAEAETAELPSAAAADDYFRRAGALLGAAWLFGARDLHMENVVATASGPVVVDGELTLQPERTAAAGGAATAFSRVNDRLRRSFAATGLLSLEQAFPDGRREEVGGLSGRGGYAASAPARVVTDPNSDAMALAERPATVPERPNLPRLEGRRLAAADRPEAVRKGFERMYRFLLSRRREIAAPGGPLEALGGVETRVVLRGSDLYARLLLALESPAYLRDGLSRSFAIDVLNRGAAAGRTRPPYWPLVADERAALEELDVPYFTVPAGSRLLRTRTGPGVEGVLSASGRGAVRGGRDRMGGEDLGAQRVRSGTFAFSVRATGPFPHREPRPCPMPFPGSVRRSSGSARAGSASGSWRRPSRERTAPSSGSPPRRSAPWAGRTAGGPTTSTMEGRGWRSSWPRSAARPERRASLTPHAPAAGRSTGSSGRRTRRGFSSTKGSGRRPASDRSSGRSRRSRGSSTIRPSSPSRAGPRPTSPRSGSPPRRASTSWTGSRARLSGSSPSSREPATRSSSRRRPRAGTGSSRRAGTPGTGGAAGRTPEACSRPASPTG